MGIDQLADRFQCEIWVDCTCTITEKSCEMMDFSRLAGFYDQTQGSTLLGFYEMLMYCGYRQKRRDRQLPAFTKIGIWSIGASTVTY